MQDCKCAAQVADILARLERLEREALTVEKLADIPAATISDLLVFGIGEKRATLNLKTGELKCGVGTIEGN